MAEAAVETVKMEDGSVEDFAGKRKVLKSSELVDGVVVTTLKFRNGSIRKFEMPDGMVAKFAAHGAEQKLGDEIAGIDDLEDAVQAVDELCERLGRGEWTVKREAGAFAGASILAKAIAAALGKSAEEVKAFLSKKTQAEKVALRSNPRIKPHVERLEAEKAARKQEKGTAVDTDAMLNELE